MRPDLLTSCIWPMAILTVASGCAAPPSNFVGVLAHRDIVDADRGIFARRVLAVNPDARIMNLVLPDDRASIAADTYQLAKRVAQLPRGSVVVTMVDLPDEPAGEPVIVETRSGHLLIGRDNGIFGPLLVRTGGMARAFRVAPPEIAPVGLAQGATLSISSPDNASIIGQSDRFADLADWAPIAAILSAGGDPESMGQPLARLADPPECTRVRVANHTFRGRITDADGAGRYCTNLPEEWAAHLEAHRRLRLVIGDQHWSARLRTAEHQRPASASSRAGVLIIARGRQNLVLQFQETPAPALPEGTRFTVELDSQSESTAIERDASRIP